MKIFTKSKLFRPFLLFFQWLGRIPLRARFGRVLLEALSLQAVIAILVPLCLPTLVIYRWSPGVGIQWDQYSSENTASVAVISFLLFSLLYCVCSIGWVVLRWRLRPPQRLRRKQFVLECGMTILLFGEVALTMALLMWGLGRVAPYTFLAPPVDQVSRSAITEEVFGLSYKNAYFTYLGIILICCCVGFLAIRCALHLLAFWNRLRRRQLAWALTHAHLMIMIWGALVFYGLAILVALASYSSSSENTPVEMVFGVTLLIGVVILGITVIGIVFVLPPSALFSYLFSRGVVRRIKNLAGAAGSLHSGDYHIRVQVDGEDEIARLQTDFNGMAHELERTMHALQEERDNVSTLLQARRELIASVSHELRTPVATVRSYLESTLSTWNATPPPMLRQDLQVMEQQVIRLQSLINDLFTLARSEVGKLEMRSVPVNVELLVQRVADTMAPVVWRGSRIDVVADIAPIAPNFPRVLGDENRLEQILQNLLHNAVRHTPPGGIIVVSARVDEQAVILEVKDTGEGIAADELAYIWERFYRAGNSRSQPGTGSGLGLAIVKDLAEAMHGTVSVASVVGQGTVFTIRLPRIGTSALLEYGQENFQVSGSPENVSVGIEEQQTMPLRLQ